MQQTVIGVFDQNSDAQNAVERLVNSGFDRGLIDISHGRITAAKPDGLAMDDETDSERITSFFQAAFSEEAETYKYMAAARDGAAIVSIQTNGEAEASRAMEVMDSCGAVDVDERSKLAQLPGPTSYEKDDFSGSDQEASKMTKDDLTPGEHRVHPVEREQKFDRGPAQRSRVAEGPVEEERRLREERIVVKKEK